MKYLLLDLILIDLYDCNFKITPDIVDYNMLEIRLSINITEMHVSKKKSMDTKAVIVYVSVITLMSE